MGDKIEPIEDIKKIIGELTYAQLILFDQIRNSPDMSSFVINPANGPVIGALCRRGLVKPVGRVGVHVRYQVCKEKFNSAHLGLIEDLLRLNILEAQKAAGAY